mgnify:CR=1 FL=1
MSFKIVSDSSSNVLSMGIPAFVSVPMRVRAEKEYIDDEPIYTGYDSYFTSGRISTVITLTSGSEVSIESSVHMRSNWTVSIDGEEGEQYCPSQIRFGDML